MQRRHPQRLRSTTRPREPDWSDSSQGSRQIRRCATDKNSVTKTDVISVWHILTQGYIRIPHFSQYSSLRALPTPSNCLHRTDGLQSLYELFFKQVCKPFCLNSEELLVQLPFRILSWLLNCPSLVGSDSQVKALHPVHV